MPISNRSDFLHYSRKCRRNRLEPPCTDPYARWCGRGRRVTAAPMPIDFGLLLRDRAVALAGRDFVILPQGLGGPIGLNLFGPVAEDPGPARPVLPRLYLGMLHPCFHS